MKRVGYLMERISHSDNLAEAFLKAAKGKWAKKDVLLFREDLSRNLDGIARDLLSGEYEISPGYSFTIHDPKKRNILAPSFRDAVTYQAVMRICHPVFDAFQVYDSFASRPGKGTDGALGRALEHARRYEWFLKLDVVKYFDSIDHRVMFSQLCRLFKDPLLLDFFHRFLSSYGSESGKGLAIGALLSQYFANHYLSVSDHYLKEKMRVPALVRYMDDFILFAHGREELLSYENDIRCYVAQTLKLHLHPMLLNKTRHGVPFLGFVVGKEGLRLSSRSRSRFRRKLSEAEFLYEQGLISEEKCRERVASMAVFVDRAARSGFKEKVYREIGLFS